ncbi:MAG: alpha/beta hydrolase [Bacillota bacterium]|nr:alpha/beta hydrolase [Bacillota bacterium]
MKQHKRLLIIVCILLAILIVLAGALIAYLNDYSHADETALAALETDDKVTVKEMDYGWFFDGPSEDTGMIFYPGGKVDERAYAPLLHRMAAKGFDVCLVRMPLHLAILKPDKADDVLAQHSYEHWYIAGHSLGGVSAADYAADHGKKFECLLLLAAYPSRQLDESLVVLSIYGSNDKVLNQDKLKESQKYMPPDNLEYIIDGGNHAQFGNYGAQDGDGKADITAEQQQRETCDVFRLWIE